METIVCQIEVLLTYKVISPDAVIIVIMDILLPTSILISTESAASDEIAPYPSLERRLSSANSRWTGNYWDERSLRYLWVLFKDLLLQHHDRR
jgi:hypothetical protein